MQNYPSDWTKKLVLESGIKVFLRPEHFNDTEMLWDMFSTLSKESLRFLVHQFTKERIENWTKYIDYEKSLPILALIQEEDRERVIGSASLHFHSLEAVKHKAELGITVHDDYQNRGLGKQMIEHLLEIAHLKGLKKIYLRVDTENIRAIHVYEKCGFKIEAKLEKEDFVNGQFRDDYQMAIFL